MRPRDRLFGTPALLLVLWPLLCGWQGSGRSDGTVTVAPLDAPERAQAPLYTAVDAVARIEPGRSRFVLLFVLPGERDAVMTLTLDTDWGTRLDLPDPLVSVVYEEFDADGRTLFLAEDRADAVGTVETVFRASGAVSLNLALRFEDAAGNRAVEFSQVALTLVPDVVAPEEADQAARAAPAGGGVAASSGGCEDDGYDGTSAQDGAWNTESTAADDSGGCDSDTDSTDYESDASDSSGCEGDDVESSSDSDSESSSDSCDGDASAAVVLSTTAPRKRVRATLPAKLVAWTPYLLVLLPLRLVRRRRLAPVDRIPREPVA
jgi:hypothetical protein